MFAPEIAGPQEPLLTSPLRPGSTRRTSSIDSLRLPDGSATAVDARARDVRIDLGGAVQHVRERHLRARIGQFDGAIAELDLTPSDPGIHALVGCRVGSGFRAAIKEQLGSGLEAGSLLHLLLDDWPGAQLVSGYSALRGTERPGARPMRLAPDSLSLLTDVCAGWATDASMIDLITRTDIMPTPLGPSIAAVDALDEQGTWHAMSALPPTATRRRRRLEVWDVDDETLGFESHFRDSYAETDDSQMALHEYLVGGTLRRADLTIIAIETKALVLPWQECPTAVASAQRLVGLPVGGLRTLVRNEFQGPSTCTHLNDTLRSLDDLVVLTAHPRGG